MTLALDMPDNGGALADLPPLGSTGASKLGKRQKAAIVVRVLLAEGARISLSDLPDALQAELARQMSGMRFVDRATLSAVIDEFLAEIDGIGLAFPSGMEGALSMLDGTISAATASRLRKQSGITLRGDPWARIAELDADRLLPVLREESVEVGAVMLSKLKVSKAAELLGRLPGDRARKITYAMSRTGAIAPEMVRKIGMSLALQLDAQPAAAFDTGPVERVGAILNFSPSATRDDVLAGLDETDAGFAAEVRKAIFTFADIPARVAPRDVPRIVRDIPPATLATVVAAAQGDLATAADYILDNMSKRLADTVREDAAALGKVRDKDAEEAMNAVVVRIREMAAAGEVFLVAQDDE